MSTWMPSSPPSVVVLSLSGRLGAVGVSLTMTQVARGAKLHVWVCGPCWYDFEIAWAQESWRAGADRGSMAARRRGGGMVVDNVSLLELQAQGSSNTRVRLGLASPTHVILIGHRLQSYRHVA